MPFNQMFTGRPLANVASHCSFTEVYLGGHAGYVQVTRASGAGPVLLVLPDAHGFEGWRPLKQAERSATASLSNEARAGFSRGAGRL